MQKTQKKLNEVFILSEINKLLQENNNQISNEIMNYIESIVQNKGIELLINIIIHKLISKSTQITDLDQVIFEKIINVEQDNIIKKLYQYFPKNIKEYKASLTIDYEPLYNLLINEKYQEADQLTQKYLCELANINNKNPRKWLYFTDILLIPLYDLFIIDLLWQVYSNEKFGFSVQKKIWIKNKYDWDVFLEKINWSEQGTMKRYPQEFIWNINAPKGHLPLFNQLRGIQVISYLFEKIFW
uniref:GUN4-like domain-containing protein n=1 Tax=Cumathamnion serrulatum TaxID=1206573 RepID=A0A7U1AR00_9FLOR|nr:hypothetical protein K4Y23_pgp141 [Cumathamnion serrulatum]QQY85305.1 hypothetical protein [Cumathamnion serrulatum]